MASHPEIHIVEGPVCAGKSTAVKKLAHALQFHPIVEVMPAPLLQAFCTAPGHWGSGLQLFAMLHRWYNLCLATTGAPPHDRAKGVIKDRSAPGDFALFYANVLLGTIDPIPLRALGVYLNLWEMCQMRNMLQGVASITYLDVSPATTLQRLGIRGTGETQQLEYFDLVDTVYFYMMLVLASTVGVAVLDWETYNNTWRDIETCGFRPCRVVLVDADDNTGQVPAGTRRVAVDACHANYVENNTAHVFDIGDDVSNGRFHNRATRRAVYLAMEHCKVLYVRVPRLEATLDQGRALVQQLSSSVYSEIETACPALAVPGTACELVGMIHAMVVTPAPS